MKREEKTLYQPRIANCFIRALYRLKQSTGIPMTRLLDRILEEHFAGSGPRELGDEVRDNEPPEGQPLDEDAVHHQRHAVRPCGEFGGVIVSDEPTDRHAGEVVGAGEISELRKKTNLPDGGVEEIFLALT